MKVVVRPVLDPKREVDLTHRLVSAIAEELWLLYGGNDKVNWLEAERHLMRIISEASAQAQTGLAAPVRSAVDTAIKGGNRHAPEKVSSPGTLGKKSPVVRVRQRERQKSERELAGEGRWSGGHGVAWLHSS